MIDDNMIERVYNSLTQNPQSSKDLAERLNMERHKLSFVLAILKRMGKAERVDLNVQLCRGYWAGRSFWVKANGGV